MVGIVMGGDETQGYKKEAMWRQRIGVMHWYTKKHQIFLVNHQKLGRGKKRFPTNCSGRMAWLEPWFWTSSLQRTMDRGSWHCTLQEAEIKTIPKKKKCKKAKWLSEEALQIAEKRREAKHKGQKGRYTHLNAEFQRIARRDKKAFLSDQ